MVVSSDDGLVTATFPNGSGPTVRRVGEDYELESHERGHGVACHISEGRDRPISSALFEAVSRRAAAAMKPKLRPGTVEIKLSIESRGPVAYATAGANPFVSWPASVSAPDLARRPADVAGVLFPNAVLSCHSTEDAHDPGFTPVVAAVAERLVLNLPPRAAASLPGYREVELVRFDDGTLGVREILVHPISGGFLTTFHESLAGTKGMSDRTIFEVSQDDDQVVREHHNFYANGNRKARYALERKGHTEYSLNVEGDGDTVVAQRTLSPSAPLLARYRMATDLRRAIASSPPLELPPYEVFEPQMTDAAFVTVRIRLPGAEATPPAGQTQISSAAAVVDKGVLSLARAYGYPSMVTLVAPPRVSGTFAK